MEASIGVGQKSENGMEKLLLSSGRTIDFANLEDCISTKGTGKEIRLFQEHG
jgi:hypothetical protein